MKTRTLHLALAALLIGCQNQPAKTTGVDARPSTKPKVTGSPGSVVPPTTVVPSTGVGPIGTLITNDGAGVISRDGAGVISRDGAGVISRDGAGITGVARLPAGVISRDGAGVISRDGAGVISRDGAGVISRDGAGFRLAAVADSVPVRQQLVYLLDAAGHLVLGADDQPITAKTDDQGNFTFKGIATQHNLLIAIQLFDDKGRVTCVLPRGDAASRTVELNLASTLTATYIQEQFVKPQTDPTATFEKLPADLEAATRQSVASAAAAAPTDLKPASVLAAVDALRKQAKAVDDQFAEVKRVLLAGLSNQGVGLPADDLESDASVVALSPTGELVFAGRASLRVWRKDAAGKLQAVAGTGLKPPDGATSGPAPGDGGPATAAALKPGAITYARDGGLLIADSGTRRVRRVAADGTISTVAAHADWDELRGIYEEPNGDLVVASHAALYRVPKGGEPALIAGKARPFDPDAFPPPFTGDGGKPLDATFTSISGLARDPLTGDALVFDSGELRRVSAGLVKAEAGAEIGVDGAKFVDGPAASAGFGAFAGLAVRPDGGILVADLTTNRIRLVMGGVVSTLAGTGSGVASGDGGPAAAAGLAGPVGLALATDGTVFVVDQGYVREIRDGQVHTLIGGTRGFDTPRPATAVQMLGPSYLSYDAVANVMWVSDQRHIWRWDLAANTMVSAFGGGIAGAPFAEGQAATATALGWPTAYVDLGGGKWATLASDPTTQLGRGVMVEGGKLTTFLGGASNLDVIGGLEGPAVGAVVVGVSADLVELDGWFYYPFSQAGRISRFQPGGKTEIFAGGGAASGDGHTAKQLNLVPIQRIAKGPDAQLYVGTNTAIYRIDPKSGQATSLAAASKPAVVAGFAWDAAGNMYFSESDAGRVRRLRKDTGAVELVAGAGAPALNGTTIDTGLGTPSALAFDAKGDLYIADTRYGQIKVVRKP